MWWRNWFCPANLAKKRSRSGSPERKPARSSSSRRALISIATHQVHELPAGLSWGAEAFDDLLERTARQQDASRYEHIRRKLLERPQVVPERRFDHVPLFHSGGLDLALEQFLGFLGDGRGDLNGASHGFLDLS